jgi:gp32 DNA binding protein like
MTLNLSALKAKLNEFTKNTNRDDSIWKPTEGKTVIRIVPWKENKENPFIELFFHYMGNKTYLSPTTYGNRDPINEFAEMVAKGGDEGPSKDSWVQSRAFRPKLRTYMPIIVRGQEDKGVRFYSFGKTVYQEILSYIADPDYGDITDITNGRDIVVEYIPQEKSDTSFAKTMVRPKPNPSPLADSAVQIEKLLTDQPDLKLLFKEPTFAELNAALADYLGKVADDTEVIAAPAPAPAAPAPISATAAKSTELKSSTSAANMIEDFDEVFK